MAPEPVCSALHNPNSSQRPASMEQMQTQYTHVAVGLRLELSQAHTCRKVGAAIVTALVQMACLGIASGPSDARDQGELAGRRGRWRMIGRLLVHSQQA